MPTTHPTQLGADPQTGATQLPNLLAFLMARRRGTGSLPGGCCAVRDAPRRTKTHAALTSNACQRWLILQSLSGYELKPFARESEPLLLF